MKTRKKHLVAMAISLLSILSGMSQTTNILVVERLNGDTVSYSITYDKPLVTFTKNAMVLKTANNKHFETSIFNVKRFTFETRPDKIEAVKKSSICFEKIGTDRYEITGLGKVKDVEVLTTDGKVISKGVTYDNGRMVVDLNDLAPCIYLIKIGNIQTTKIIKQ